MDDTVSPYKKYQNPDPRCSYPFTPDPVGYCWSFAHHVDGTQGYEDIEKICLNCEFWDKGEIDNDN